MKTWYLPFEFPLQSLDNELRIEDMITQTVFSQFCYLCYLLARGKSRQFAKPPLVFPWNDVWETRAETPYWWHNTAHIWIVLLIGWKFASSNQKPLIKFQLQKYNRIWHYLTRKSLQVNNIIMRLFYHPDLGSDASSVWNFCSHFSGLEIKKILRSPFGDQLEKYNHQMQIFSCQFVQCKWCSS